MKRFVWFLGLTVLVTGCGKGGLADLFFRQRIEFFGNCDDVKSYAVAQRKSQRDAADSQEYQNGSGTPVSVGASASADSGGTNVQEKDVDEGDTVKVGDHHFYIASESGIQVIDRANLALLGTLPPVSYDNELYADGDRLVVLATSGGSTHVEFYSGAAHALPTRSATKVYDGTLTASRYANGRLVLVMRDEVETAQSLSDDAQCRTVARPFVEDWDLAMTTVVSVNASSPDDVKTLSEVGGGDVVYMTAKSLYIVKQYIYWRDYKNWDKMIISKIDLADGTPKLVAMGTFAGRVNNQWALKEYDTALAVAATSTKGNSLSMITQTGSVLAAGAKVDGFGVGESIYGVRYVDDIAYVVTFRQTDPLWVIDLSNKTAPKLLGELKVPGYSTYLHPVAPGRLVGVGVDRGTQVSLFDTTALTSPQRLDVHLYSDWSSAIYDHHAFFFDAASTLLALPLREGMQVYRVTGNALVDIARLTHARWIPANCQSNDVQRLLRVDGKLVSFSRWGVVMHSIDNPANELGATKFLNVSCNQAYYGNYY